MNQKRILLIFLFIYSAVFARDVIPVTNVSSGEILQAIKKLKICGSALYIAAHPDDENTTVISYLANGLKVSTAYLAITRGDGGQNLIGSETDDLLGVLRTQELLSARRIDGGEQFFTRAIDFGYSKSARESLEKWDHEKVLSDVVWVIRRFRPDVIITRFTTENGGHGHHLASAVLALEAFSAAGDKSRFPEQLKFTETWQATRLVWNAWGDANENLPGVIKSELGEYNALLGKSYPEIAALARSMHKSQGFGASAIRGSFINYFQLTKGKPFANNLFDGIDLTWSRIKNGAEIDALISNLEKQFNPNQPHQLIPGLVELYKKLDSRRGEFWPDKKKEEVLDLIRACSGLWLEAISENYNISPGNTLTVNFAAINRSQSNLQVLRIRKPFADKDSILFQNLSENSMAKINFTIKIPEGLPYTNPYWLNEKHEEGFYTISDQMLIGLAEKPSPLMLQCVLQINNALEIPFSVPVLYRWTDRVKGERYRPVEIVPPVTVNFEKQTFVFTDNSAQVVRCRIKNWQNSFSGELKLEVPADWRSEPVLQKFSLEQPNEEIVLEFHLFPSGREETTEIKATIIKGSTEAARDYEFVEYDHILFQSVFKPVSAVVCRVNIQKAGQNIGYIMGSGDAIPDCLEQIGYKIFLLNDEEINYGDLALYDAIIIGTRAYNTRENLPRQQSRLFSYAEKGGTLVTLHNTRFGFNTDQISPLLVNISRERVCEEDASVNFVRPEHVLLTFPNKIRQTDFDGWVQERGLYFADKWDAQYETPLAIYDNGETPKEGGLLFLKYGKGYYIFSPLAWFRQLPAGVPGAYRLFANILSVGKQIQ